MLDFTLTPEQLFIAEKSARVRTEEKILPLAWFYDEANEIPMHILDKASALGLNEQRHAEEIRRPGLWLLSKELSY